MHTRMQPSSHIVKPTLVLSLVAALLAGCRPSDSATPLVEPSRDALATVSVDRVSGRPLARHVLLLSIDGFHATDLVRFVAGHPASALARLSRHGTSFLNASTSKPSDSFPGLLAMVTGASPKVTGVYYDDSYDRLLSAPGSNCSTRGDEIVYDESIDIDSDRLDGGGGIDPAKSSTDRRDMASTMLSIPR